MRNIGNWLVRGLFASSVIAALSFGASQLFAEQECDGPGQVGTCPPLNSETCDAKCAALFGTFGDCFQNGCCTCAL